MPDSSTTRRSFFGLSAGAALLCTIGGQEVRLDDPDAARKADALAAQVKRPPGASPQDQLSFPTPEPQPGGVRREYWVQARTRRWDVAPTGRDDWHNRAVGGKRSFRALVYQLMQPGFAAPAGPALMPGPTLYAEVGDVLVVHFRNAATKLAQALTMHPHGVRYTPTTTASSSASNARRRVRRAGRGVHLHVGGDAGLGRRLAVPRPRPEPHAQHVPRRVRRGRDPRARRQGAGRRARALPAPAAAADDGPRPRLPGDQRAHVRGQHADDRGRRVGQDVALHVIGMDNNFHDFHIHGHRWKDSAGAFVDTPSVGPNETITARFTEDNPGRWLYHCHVFSHQDGGHGRLVHGEPLRRKNAA